MSTPTSTATVPGGRPAAAGAGSPVATATAPAQSAGDSAFELAAAWQLNPKVALRPEPFGALLYHFGTRKLSFLKNLTVVGIVQSLTEHESAESALVAAGITDAERPLYLQALTALAESAMIVRRT